MKYPAYPKYKDSDVEWLGDIPEHWEIWKGSHMLRIYGGYAPESVTISPEGIPYFKVDGLNQNEGKHSLYLSTSTQNVQVTVGLKPIEPPLILIPKRGAAISTNKVRIATKSCLFDSNIMGIQALRKCHVDYMAYILLSRGLWDIADVSTIPQINNKHINPLKIPVPPSEEQQAIITHIGVETTKIDSLIEKKGRQIELLREKRAAMISHAVTRGLDPNVKLKPSNIPWLGDVPKHWKLKRLRHISPKIGVGLVINPSTYVSDIGKYFLFGANVTEFGFKLEACRKISLEDSKTLHQSMLHEGDLVSVRVGYPGITAVIPSELEQSNCASMMIVRRGNFYSKWLCYAMNSWMGKKQFERVLYGAAQKQFNISDAVDFIFIVPPISEQQTIAKYLDEQTSKIDHLIEKVKSSIEKLTEYRTALISAAVTGKIDVRKI